MIINLIYLCFCLAMARHGKVEAYTLVKEVKAGDLVVLPCLSNDDFHRFMFWQLSDNNRIVGPGNPVDEQKFNYEVLTGKLFIRAVSTADSGFYKCVSRGLENHSVINIHTIELIVRKGTDQGESSFETNLLRGMAVTMIIVVGIAVTLLVIMLRRRRNNRFFDIMEESRESSPAKYIGTIQSAPITPSPRTLESEGIDNMGLDVDFPKVFQQMQSRPLQ